MVLNKVVEEQIELMATLTIQKVNKRPGKDFSLQQGIGGEQQSDSNTNNIDWSGDQAINTKDNHHSMEIRRSLGIR